MVEVRIIRRVGFLLVALVAVLVATAGPASAHAVLDRSDPVGGSTLAAPPSAVMLSFSESVTTDPRSITVISAAGKRVDSGDVRHGQAGNQVVVGLPAGLARGTYVVSWHVISADSHPVAGGFIFGVGVAPDAAAAAAVSTNSGSAGVSVLAGVIRFVAFAGLSVLLGAGFFLVALWPAGLQRTGPSRLLWTGWGVTLAGAVGLLLVQGPYGAGQGLSALTQWAPLSTTLHTRFGHLVLLRILALLLAVPLLRAIVLSGRRAIAELGGLGLVVAVTQAASGHAGVGDDAWLATTNLTLHVLGVAAWTGGLAVLVVFLRTTSRRGPADDRNARPDARVPDARVPAARAAELARVLPHWSRTAMAAVGVIILTGVYQTWREVGGLAALTATAYGRLLLLKVWFVALMLGIGWLAHRWVVRHYRPVVAALAASRSDTGAGAAARPPGSSSTGAQGRLQATKPAVTEPVVTERAVTGLRRGVMFEAGLAAVVLAVTAVLVNSIPARTSYVPPFADTVFAGPLTVQVDISPTRHGPQTLHIYTFDPVGKVAPLADASAQLSLPDAGVGPLPVSLTQVAPGHAIAQAMQVPLPGTWQLRLTLRVNDFDQYVTTLFYQVR
ncbi:copper resistance protein CopC [Frankia sp. Cas3]|uniref:copper resistance CopC/CopD family protein n=1 Tax=Frankia sp. Cas3 TaxID=3073926 RepID=UPI002AD328AA|nr:copper resistance protein CopC [Frankia sp. Cas3]